MRALRRLAVLAALCAAPQAWAASPTVERSTSGNGNGVSTFNTTAFQVSNANSLILIWVGAENVTGSGAAPTISAPTYNGLTFTKRSTTQTAHLSGCSTPWARAELWSAWSTGTQTSAAATIGFSGTVDEGVAVVVVVNGTFSSAAPFDPNAGLAAQNQNLTGSTNTTGVSGFNTTNADDLLLYFGYSNSSTGWGNSTDFPTGFTGLQYPSNTSGINFTNAGSAYKSVSAAQSSQTISWDFNKACWFVTVDAVTSDAAPVSGPPIGSMMLQGVGK